jgi:hypothetical protein
MRRIQRQLILFMLSLLSVSAMTVRADEIVPLSLGQKLYVPAYSHIFIGNREQSFMLTVTLSIRNIDTKHPITITSVEYFDTQGKLVKKYLSQAVSLNPLESTHYIVPEKDTAGGVGANFIVEWRSEKAVNLPVIECVMIGTASQQGVSFTSRGQAITTSN